jgi:uncharacterized membrane protein
VRVAAARPYRDLPSATVVFFGLVGLSIVLFVVMPWSLQTKSIAVLHGLCAQRPSHSFWFGSERLPFDARMTGIYTGLLAGQLYLLARGRLGAARLPSLSVLSALALSVLALGIDGVNSTLNDAGLIRLYQPTNAGRFVTGSATGTTLAVTLWLLVGNVVWKPSRRTRRPVVASWWELPVMVAPALALGLLAASRWTPLYRPITLLLILGAVLALFELMLAFLQLARRREGTARAPRDLAGPATLALLLAYAFMLSLAGGRFALEWALHLPQPI